MEIFSRWSEELVDQELVGLVKNAKDEVRKFSQLEVPKLSASCGFGCNGGLRSPFYKSLTALGGTHDLAGKRLAPVSVY